MFPKQSIIFCHLFLIWFTSNSFFITKKHIILFDHRELRPKTKGKWYRFGFGIIQFKIKDCPWLFFISCQANEKLVGHQKTNRKCQKTTKMAIHIRRQNILGREGGSQILMLQDIRRWKLGKSGSKFRHGGGGHKKRTKKLRCLLWTAQ